MTDLEALRGLPTTHPQVQALVRQGVATVLNDELWIHIQPQSDEWAALFESHRRHAGFQAHTWAYSREFGFSCTCGGEYAEWRIGLRSFRQAMVQDGTLHPRFERSVAATAAHGRKRVRRDAARALIKSRALLGQYLTREQKWELRATDGFTVTAPDGRIFRINRATANNVRLIENGVAVQSLCVVTTNHRLPVYDLMLAQKFMLECETDEFVRLAVKTNLRPPVREFRPTG